MTTTVYVSRGRRRRRYVLVLLALCLAAITSWKAADALAPPHQTSVATGGTTPTLDWPARGSAAVAVGGGTIRVSGATRPVPIASLAKVMTAVVVLHRHPLSTNDSGFTLTITADDVDDARHRRSEGQSVVTVAAGERLTERQALQALLLPSANNIALVLARVESGSVDDFVDDMNAEARRLGMSSTDYTDPSGYAATTVSTARDQVLLARAAMRIDAFAEIVGEPDATIPEAGVVHNTDTLLGSDGFVGIKTGSDSAAGGCFMFAARDSNPHQLVYGVVLGQVGGPLIPAALKAARRLADSVRPEFHIA